MYLTNMRLDIVLIVKLVVSRYMDEPQQIHLDATWHILCYLRGTSNFMCFVKRGVITQSKDTIM
jgi:hypothetical protein